MQTINLNGLRVTLGEPVQVVEGIGHLWFPSLDKLPTGELIVSYILGADTNDNHVDGYGVSVSKDGGQTWLPRYDVAGFGGGAMVRIPQPDGSLAGPNFYVYPDPPGQHRTFRGPFERFSHGGEEWSLQPWGTRVVGMPRDLEMRRPDGTWGRRAPANFSFYGDAIAFDGGYATTPYIRYAEDKGKYSVPLLRTDDLGRTWRFVGDVARIHDVPDLAEGAEGPNESSLVRLESGDLMCIMRVGSGQKFPLARAYSADGGKTWSKPDRLPAFSVAPSAWRAQNGVVALGTGRPGIFLWLADDPRATRWQSVDVLAHHAAWTSDTRHRIRGERQHNAEQNYSYYETTSYVELHEVAPNRLLMVYDRVPNGWRPVAADSGERNRIYIVAIDIARA